MIDAIEQDLSIKLCTIDGKPFVAGLLWEQLHKIRSYMKEARELGKTLGMDVVAIRRATGAVQAGYSPKNRGALKGMYSLAASVAGVIGPNSIVAFRIPADEQYPAADRYGMVATKGDLIIAGSDLIGSKEEVEQEFRAFYNRLDGWERVEAPAEFEVAEAEFDVAAALLGKIRKEHRLQALTFGLSRAEWIRYGSLAGAAAAVIAVSWYGWNVYQARQAEKAHEALVTRQREAALRAARDQANATKPSLPHPWAKQHGGDALLQACADRRHPLPLSVRGWVLATMRCTDGAFGVVYTQANGVPFTAFAEGVQARFGVQPTAQDDAYTAGGLAAPVTIAAPFADEALAADAAARAAFFSHFQALGLDVALQFQPPPASKPGAKEPALQPDWRTYSFTIAGQTPPEALFADMDMTGLRITEIDTTLDSKTAALSWTVKGNLYAR